jgi:hypothetical protein
MKGLSEYIFRSLDSKFKKNDLVDAGDKMLKLLILLNRNYLRESIQNGLFDRHIQREPLFVVLSIVQA